MILVRMVFQAQPGQAGEMAKLIADNFDLVKKMTGEDVKVRVLTDLSGPFDTVVEEIVVDSLAAWEENRARMFSSPEFTEAFADRRVSYVSGRTEYYTIEAES